VNSVVGNDRTKNVATVYNRAGDSYSAYADGDPERLFCFEGLHAYADQYVWSVIEAKLMDLRMKGAWSVRILDIGCGPGTWLRRLVTRAKTLGFTSIVARGFDVAEVQVQAARLMAHDISGTADVDLTLDVGDLSDPLPEADASVDITLCLYSVLSHLPVASLSKISEEIGRVTRGHFITTVRSIGSMPTIFVDSIEKARHFELDHTRDQCRVELYDGRQFTVGFHLFSSAELQRLFENCFIIEDLCGLDLFHSRFTPDARWNPASVPIDRSFRDHLVRLESAYSRNSVFMERATHLLLVGSRHYFETSATGNAATRIAARKGCDDSSRC
jgi:SAM-dependent methyltransferase